MQQKFKQNDLRSYSRKLVTMQAVIKLGGSILIDEALRNRLILQIAELHRAGSELILVHGGGKQIAALLTKLGVESRFHDGLRITDAAARNVVQMVLGGQVGKDLVAELARAGVNSASITGGDGQSFLAEKMAAEDGTDLGFVGRIVKTNSALIDAMLAADVMPVVACLALGADDQEYYNVNGDQMAASVAAGCAAETLVFVTDVGGVLDGDGQPIAELSRESIQELLASGVASGGMRPKLRACLEALEAGVGHIHIVGAAEENVLPRLLQMNQTLGTRISA
jgi:acetylglutamate kinase